MSAGRKVQVFPDSGIKNQLDARAAVFHGWGNDYTEFEAGPGNYTVAICEFEDGTVELVYPPRLKFIETTEQ